ncbi:MULTISPECIES: hypothetical protein [Caulobacter]|jgi:hypothetical protein|uniref:Spore coat protein U domain-containing protein n=1 Tax=Caulobacter rhizosphaerae TaxID=2010972 RepID=A0ABU1N458_9CAUL|nr:MULTISPECIES: hypothetical protein [Caulobacter]KQZ27174.1 hypothetical protein ASD47_05530 [Caulobacter sp. Root1472]MDR6533047.1 hypothetical protein [Caulobacter rhizosphaerae]GGL33861.1 hypothetical protein GCM10010983_33730 [Caulobacter rhizosphaerae]
MNAALVLAPFIVGAALGAAAPAQAQTASTGDRASNTLDLFGVAPSACVLSPPSSAAGTNASFTAQGAQGVVRFTQFIDPQTAQPRDAVISLGFPVVCNSAHRLVVRTDGAGLARTAGPAPAAGFRDSLGFQLSADWAGLTATGPSTSLTPISLQTANGAAGLMNLTVNITGGGAPMVAGDYAGTLVVEIEASN